MGCVRDGSCFVSPPDAQARPQASRDLRPRLVRLPAQGAGGIYSASSISSCPFPIEAVEESKRNHLIRACCGGLGVVHKVPPEVRPPNGLWEGHDGLQVPFPPNCAAPNGKTSTLFHGLGARLGQVFASTVPPASPSSVGVAQARLSQESGWAVGMRVFPGRQWGTRHTTGADCSEGRPRAPPLLFLLNAPDASQPYTPSFLPPGGSGPVRPRAVAPAAVAAVVGALAASDERACGAHYPAEAWSPEDSQSVRKNASSRQGVAQRGGGTTPQLWGGS
eukprot:gene24231-biopygen13431